MAMRKVTIQYKIVTTNGKDCFQLADTEVAVDGIPENPTPVPRGTAYVQWEPVKGGHVQINIHTGTVTTDDEIVWLTVRHMTAAPAPYLRAVIRTTKDLHPLEGEPNKLVSPAETDAGGAPIKRDWLNQPGQPDGVDMNIHPQNGCDHAFVDSNVHVEC